MSEQRYNEFREEFHRNNGRYPTINELQRFVDETVLGEVSTYDEIKKINENSRLRREQEIARKNQSKIIYLNKQSLHKKTNLRRGVAVFGTVLMLSTVGLGVAAIIQSQSPVDEVKRALEGAYHIIDPVTGKAVVYNENKVDLYAGSNFVESAALYMFNNGVSQAVAEETLISFFTIHSAAVSKSEFAYGDLGPGALAEGDIQSREKYDQTIHKIVTSVYMGQEVTFVPYVGETKSR